MFSPTNIENELLKSRSKRISSEAIMEEVQKLFSENEVERNIIKENLTGENRGEVPNFNLDLLESDRIFHLSDIKKLCIVYRLRFLDSHFFKPDFPEETISTIRDLEREHSIKIENFKIMAPSRLLKLENADDPLLFASLGNGYFYLVHKWGCDLHPFRKILMWPYKNLENFIVVITVLSFLCTAFILETFVQNPGIPEYVLTFLFILKMLGGVVIYYGFANGKNFNEAIWKSRFYNA